MNPVQFTRLCRTTGRLGLSCWYRSDLWNLHRPGKKLLLSAKTREKPWLTTPSCATRAWAYAQLTAWSVISDQSKLLLTLYVNHIAIGKCLLRVLNLNIQNPHKQITFVVFHPRYIWLGQTDNNYRYTYVVAYVYNEVLLLYTTVNNQRSKLT